MTNNSINFVNVTRVNINNQALTMNKNIFIFVALKSLNLTCGQN